MIATAERRAGREAVHRVAQARVVPARESEERELHEADDRVGGGEEQRRVVERLRHAEGDDEQRGHRDEDREPDDPFLRIDHARQPRVADPCPPEQAEHEEAPGEPLPGRIRGHQRRALGEREHEDEIEEQLERQDALLLAQHRRQAAGASGRFGGHRAILATASRVRAARRQAKPQRAADYDRSDVFRRTGPGRLRLLAGRARRDLHRRVRGLLRAARRSTRPPFASWPRSRISISVGRESQSATTVRLESACSAFVETRAGSAGSVWPGAPVGAGSESC